MNDNAGPLRALVINSTAGERDKIAGLVTVDKRIQGDRLFQGIARVGGDIFDVRTIWGWMYSMYLRSYGETLNIDFWDSFLFGWN